MAVENTEHNKDIVRRAIAAMSRGDMAGFLADAADATGSASRQTGLFIERAQRWMERFPEAANYQPGDIL